MNFTWSATPHTVVQALFFSSQKKCVFTSEDVGNSDPYALGIAMDAMEAFKFIGQPEGELALAQAAVYLATAPKSNSIIYRIRKSKRSG